ncbi:Uncharacterized membrane protein YdjX, TVP38/TMEM64 family, SNARE-associated domain [Haloplanus vescus]|uniref:Uncharacterized membrane protein YdjX, TVP38/TMEM64 family, SNARE-associated domain n=1 Tax=Haloplanus vescus TaxID=555874 RepID=A0A1H4AQV7_9EURY|nr:VTT domain-containing protein [Haloplanus vescus]SEA38285.1 Uncharacterized membrane protein YdjX, TVP38/TMEM64 family, SNARE-associated domain [Haloplanus vescus]
MSPFSRQPLFALLAFTLLILLGAVGLWTSPTQLLDTIQSRHHHWTTILVVIFVLYLVRPFLLWPLSPFSVFVGYMYGVPAGLLVALCGTLFTSYPPYIVATHFRERSDYFAHFAERGAAVADTTGEVRGMIAARISPAPADAVSYTAGVAGVSTTTFAIGTLLGELPWALFYVLLGQSIHRFALGAISGTGVLFLVGASLASALILAQPAYRVARAYRDGEL